MNARIGKYLIVYNCIQLTGWFLTFLALILFPVKSFKLLCFVQLFAAVEILHAHLKWIKSNFLFTFLQTGARIIMLVVIIQLNIGLQHSNQTFINLFTVYQIMALAWCVAEIIRSSYYLKKSSQLITWLRYNAFIICYPVGVTTELYLIYSLLIYKSKLSVTIALILLMLTYFIGFPSLYLHLLKQRKQNLK
jgi:very-long-chain (3R)-3-hydroxyacyl-CoA dehydratase